MCLNSFFIFISPNVKYALHLKISRELFLFGEYYSLRKGNNLHGPAIAFLSNHVKSSGMLDAII